MSTRSYICKVNKDNTLTGIYCHSDGYLTHNGAILLDHYATPERVDKLLEGGNLSSLGPKIEPDPNQPHSFDFDERQDGVCVYYGRDRGETGQEAHPITLKDLNSPDSWIDYCYIFGKDNVWRYFRHHEFDKTGLQDVKEGLDKEYEGLGFPRPPDYYGYFSPDAIKHYQKLHQASLNNEEME